MLLTRRSLIGGAGAIFLSGCVRSSQPSIVFADVSRIWWNANPIIALEQSRFSEQPFNLSVFEVATGRESLDAVVAGNADLGMAAGSPLLFAAKAGRTREVQVLASIARSDGLVGIVNDRPLNNALPTAPIGFVPSTVSEYVLQLYARSINRPLAATSLIQLRPADLPIQFVNGAIRSFVFPEPYPTLAYQQAPEDRKPTIVRPRGLYQMEFFIFGNRRSIAEKAEAINGFLSVLKQTSVWALAHPREAMAAVASATGTQTSLFADLWRFADLRVTDTPSYLAAALDSEAETAHAVGVTETKIDLASLVSRAS